MTDGPGRPPLGLSDLAAPLLITGALAATSGVSVLVWLGCLAAAAPGTVAPTPTWPVLQAIAAALGHATLDPLIGARGSRIAFWAVTGASTGLVVAVAATLTWWALQRSGGFGGTARSLARRRDYPDMHGKGAAKRATGLRPSLAGRAVHPHDLGLRLGRLGRTLLYAAEEDVMLHIAGPRSNKTSALVVPSALSAPGPLIATSNKVDLYLLTAALRAQVGRVFILDPQRIVAGVEQTWWWNPLATIRDVADAQHLVAHFSQTVGAGHERADPYFTKGAERLLGQLCLAAALAGGNLRDVRQWLATRSETPVGLLRDNRRGDVATALLGTIEAPPDQRGGLYETALTAISCLESEAVARYVTPPATWLDPPRVARIEEFDPWQFLAGYRLDGHGRPAPHDSLYLLTREGAGSAAPVVAALVDHVLRITADAATARGGRTDPPVRAVLDEAANICPIRNLPDLYSYFGSMSIQVMTFLQSYQQGVHIWGRAGMDKLWSAATVKLIGAGVHEPSFCEDLSRLIGEHDIRTWTHQQGRGAHTSISTRRDRILSAADVAQLRKTEAIVLSAGRKPGRIQLLPWYTESDADDITAHAAEATAQVREAAVHALGPDNPLARVLGALP